MDFRFMAFAFAILDGGFLKNVKKIVQHFSPSRNKLDGLSEVGKTAEKTVKTPLEISVNVDNSSESEQEDVEDYKKGTKDDVNTFYKL